MKRIDKRRIVASIVIAAVVLQTGLAGVMFFLRQGAEGRLEAERTNRNELDVRVEMAEQVTPVPTLDGAAPSWTLDEAPDVSGTLQVIHGISDKAGVELSTLKASKSNSNGKQTYQITGVATPSKICQLIAGIELHQRLVIVETGRILPGTATEVVFDLGLATYHPRKETGQ